MMDSEIVDSIIYFMNQSELSFLKGQSKKVFVMDSIMKRYPDLDKDVVEDTLELLISVSKATMPVLFNNVQQKCNSCNII